MTDRSPDNPRLLAQAMARATGLDLAQAQCRGQITADDVSDLMQACRQCRAWQACPGWIAAQDNVAARAPGYCRNRVAFDRLQDRRVADALS